MASRSNAIRFSGLSSGLDTESIVNALLLPQKSKVDSAEQNKKLLEIKKDKWKEMNTKVYGFYTGTLTKLKLTTTFGNTKQTVTNAKAISVDKSSAAYGGTHKIQVTQLASAATLRTGAVKTQQAAATGQTKLTDLGLNVGDSIKLSVDGDSSYTIPSVEVTANMTMDELKTALNSNLKGTDAEKLVNVSFEGGKLNVSLKDGGETPTDHTIEMTVNGGNPSALGLESGSITVTAGESKTIGSHILNYNTGKAGIAGSNVLLTNLGFNQGNIISFKVGEKELEVEVDKDTTIASLQRSMEDKMKEQNIENVDFKYDSTMGTFIIGTTDCGSDKKIEMTVKESASDAVGGTSKLENLGIKSFKSEGTNARFTYNGGEILEYNSNNISINGLKCTLLEVTATEAADGTVTGETVEITSTRDTTSMKEFVKKFIEEYNTLLDEINKLVYADSIRDYKPLTDEQKESMSESEIKKWEEKISGGILRNDSVLRNLADAMQSIMSTTGMAELGITTGSDWTERGKLYINEETLDKMLTDNPDKVVETIRSVGTNLYDDIKERLKGSAASSSNYLFADKTLKLEIDDAKTSINKAKDRYDVLETMYYSRFTAMEKALSQLNSQSSIFSTYTTS